MTNKENFKEEIFGIACEGDIVAVDKETNKPCKCSEMEFCSRCALWEGDMECTDALVKWLKAEHVKPCPFEKDELVEVSNDGHEWHLGYFSHRIDDMYYTFANGNKSTEIMSTYSWWYCRKYGTLGGLVKGE